jgi:hypothetical protein
LAVRLDVVPGLQVLVDDLALEGAHRLELDRATIVYRGLGSLVSSGFQRYCAPFAIAGRVDDDPQWRSAATKRYAVCEVLDRVDRLAVVPDQQPEVLADELRVDPVCLFPDIDRRLDSDAGRDPLEQFADALGRGYPLRPHR